MRVFRDLGRLGPDLIGQSDRFIQPCSPQKLSNSPSKRQIGLQNNPVPVINMPQPTTSVEMNKGKAREVPEEVAREVVRERVEEVTEEAPIRVTRSVRVVKNPRKM